MTQMESNERQWILAIDPGTDESAYVVFDGERVRGCSITTNSELLNLMQPANLFDTLVIEAVSSFGMAVGREVFETVWWSGRFFEKWESSGGYAHRLYRHDVKLHICGQTRAKDANIRQALIDRFGGSRTAAVGTKKKPGPLYGVRSHCWAALAVAVTWWDLNRGEVAAVKRTREIKPN